MGLKDNSNVKSFEEMNVSMESVETTENVNNEVAETTKEVVEDTKEEIKEE